MSLSSCCKGNVGSSNSTCATSLSQSLSISAPTIIPEARDTCCTEPQIKPDTKTEALQDKETVIPCVKCDGVSGSGQLGQPCCDTSCIARIALRECEDACGSGSCDNPTSDSHGAGLSATRNVCCAKATKSAAKGPCQRHIQSAKSRFQPTLDALGCICRVLSAFNIESCCLNGQNMRRKSFQSSPSTNTSRPSSPTPSKRAKRDGCCSESSPGIFGKPVKPSHVRASYVSDKISSCQDLGPSKLAISCTERKGNEMSHFEVTGAIPDSCCSGGSCSEKKDLLQAKGSGTQPDLEKGLLSSEKVVLSVQGMTCTGCETKLERTLVNIPGVSKIKTSLVLSRAEFHINPAQISCEEAVQRLQKATGFECQKISQTGHELEVMSPPTRERLPKHLPSGVLSLSSATDTTIKISYDPHAIGARDVVEKIFDRQLELAPNRPDPSISVANKHAWQVGIATFISACLTLPVLILAWAPLPKRDIIYGSVSLVLATIIQIFIAGPFYAAALRSLVFAQVIEMDLLIVLSTSAAYIFSVVAFALLVADKPLSTGEFFETSTLLVTLIMLGRFITALARQKAIESISVRALQQSTVLLVEGDGTHTRDIDVRLLQYGDVFRVMPEAKIVTDGTVISGDSEVDESMISGETSLVPKTKGSLTIAGSVNGSGIMDVRLTRLCDDNTISTIANMVDEAKLSKPKTQEIADSVAGYFVPVVIVITIVTFVIWIAVGIAIQRKSSSDATVQAVTYAIAVLIISCPCAIGLAVPMVTVIAGGVAADNGVVFKSADTIEVAKNISHVVFDKTGTLTMGRPSVQASRYIDGLIQDVKPILLGLVSEIKHPASQGIAEHLQSLGVSPATVSDIKSLPGQGVIGNWNGSQVRAGNAHWTQVISLPDVQQMLLSGNTVLCFTINNTLQAVYALQDALRPEAAHVVLNLRARRIITSIVSGDEPGAVRKIAETLEIPPSNTLSRCSPADKQAYVQKLKASMTKSTILFLGDGTNDAIALASADIGVHMSEGTDVARSAADVVLTRSDLRGILVLIELSRKAMRRIKFNFMWSFVYNLFAILLAAGAFVNFRIPPAFAGVGEIVSVLPVIAIAVGLRWSKFSV